MDLLPPLEESRGIQPQGKQVNPDLLGDCFDPMASIQDSLGLASTSPDRQKKGTRPMFAAAAESIAARAGLSPRDPSSQDPSSTGTSSSGVLGTVVDVVRVRALSHYAEGLRQYLTFRLGDLEDAKQALTEVQAMVAAQGAEQLVQAPGIRARLFQMARRMAQKQGQPLQWADSTLGLPVRSFHDPAYNEALARLRKELQPLESELLELCYARELTLEEVAFVVERNERDVREHLETALSHAQLLLGEQLLGDPKTAGQRPESSPTVEPLRTLSKGIKGDQRRGLGSALLDAFALESVQEESKPGATDTHAPLCEGTTIGNRFRVLGRAGSGSFADVYRAVDTHVPNHVVALKLLHQPSYSQQARDAALRELRLIASVFHPSVVQFKDHGWHEGRLWFVMPWYDGETLGARLKRGALSRAEARPIFEKLAYALATMHAVGIRHQDIKPDNILLTKLEGFGGDTEEGLLPVLLDLGVAAKEAEMVVAGTPTYFAPEVAAQFANAQVKPPVGAKADVFSLALALRNALDPETQEEVQAGAVESFVAARASVVPEHPRTKDLRFLRSAFDRWMSLDPKERPTAEEFAKELTLLTRPEEQRAKRARLVRWLAPTTLALGAVFAAVVFVMANQTEFQRLQAEQARAEFSAESQRRMALEQDVARIEDRYQQSRLTRMDLAHKLGEAEASFAVSQSSLATERRRTGELTSELETANAHSERLAGDLRQRSAELNEAQQTVAAREEALAHTEQQLNQTRKRADDTAQELVQAQARTTDLETQWQASEARNLQLGDKLARQQSQVVELEQRMAVLQRQAARLQQQLADQQRTSSDQQRTLAQQQNELARKQDELALAHQETARAYAQIASLNSSATDLRRDLERANQRASTMEQGLRNARPPTPLPAPGTQVEPAH